MSDKYYHGLLRKYIILFGTVFNDIYIDRVDDHETAQKTIKVPLSYGPKEWYLARLNDNPNLKKPINNVLPRMAFELNALRYANERKMNTTNVTTKNTSLTANRQRILGPVPYDLHIRMSIITRNADDASRIVEQIVPRFTPELTLTLKSVPGMDIVNDVPIVLQNVELDDKYEGDMSNDDRTVIWNLDFLIKAYFYGPIGTGKVIKEIDLNLFDDTDGNKFLERIHIRPGMTAGGEATTDPTQTVGSGAISKEDDWDFIVEFFGEPIES